MIMKNARHIHHAVVVAMLAMTVFFFGALVLGCGGEEDEENNQNDSCVLDSDCDRGMLCNNMGKCQAGVACAVDEECPLGQYCDTDQGVCRITTDPCGGRCTAGETCIFGQCKTVCSSDAQCGADEFCDLSAGTGTCEPKPLADGDIDPDGDVDGDVTEDDTVTEEDTADPVDNGGRPEGEPCVDSTECNSGLSCFKYVCRTICEPAAESTGCPSDKLCHLPLEVTDGDLYGTGRGVCLSRDPAGGNIGDPCYADLACQVNLVCLHNDRCVEVCNPENESSCPAANEYCMLQNDLGTGFCLTCSDGAECPENTECNEDSNTCDPLVNCLDDPSVCALPDVCDRATGFCRDGCQITGCPTGFCNRETGFCEYTCVPACAEGTCCNSPNSCGECCDPPCPGGQMCMPGNTCQESTDCRLNPSLCEGDTLQCNGDTGQCDLVCPPVCPDGQFCDGDRTGNVCRPPFPDECSPQYPFGNCPQGYLCNNGICINQCVPDNGFCDATQACCNGTACCIGLYGSMCCGQGYECMPMFGCMPM